MKNLKTLIFAGVMLSLASCTVIRPYAVTNNAIGDGVGVSKTTLVFGTSVGNQLEMAVFSTNKNFGVVEAARNGNLDKIATVDVQTSNFGFFTTVKIIVTGTEFNN
ncbi:MAG: hypothetical protein ACI80H_000486 [Pseudoalteromonas distincta]|jgi:hypothetical protein